jgi:ERCC4-type nuclease
MTVIILVDSREKKPLFTSVATTRVVNLKTGDYSLEGKEDIVCIERKASPAELAGNVREARFADWVNRLAAIENPYLVCEFSEVDLLNFPKNARIPWRLKRRIRIKGPYIRSKLQDIEDLGVRLIFAGNAKSARLIIWNILDSFERERSL